MKYSWGAETYHRFAFAFNGTRLHVNSALTCPHKVALPDPAWRIRFPVASSSPCLTLCYRKQCHRSTRKHTNTLHNTLSRNLSYERLRLHSSEEIQQNGIESVTVHIGWKIVFGLAWENVREPIDARPNVTHVTIAPRPIHTARSPELD